METMKKNWFLDYIRSFRVIQLAHYMTFPLTVAYQWFKFCLWFVNTFTFCSYIFIVPLFKNF